MKDRLLWTRVDAGGAVAGEGGDAIVPWWSLTKPAIAAAALRLAAAGRLDLDAPVRGRGRPARAPPARGGPAGLRGASRLRRGGGCRRGSLAGGRVARPRRRLAGAGGLVLLQCRLPAGAPRARAQRDRAARAGAPRLGARPARPHRAAAGRDPRRPRRGRPRHARLSPGMGLSRPASSARSAMRPRSSPASSRARCWRRRRAPSWPSRRPSAGRSPAGPGSRRATGSG